MKEESMKVILTETIICKFGVIFPKGYEYEMDQSGLIKHPTRNVHVRPEEGKFLPIFDFIKIF